MTAWCHQPGSGRAQDSGGCCDLIRGDAEDVVTVHHSIQSRPEPSSGARRTSFQAIYQNPRGTENPPNSRASEMSIPAGGDTRASLTGSTCSRLEGHSWCLCAHLPLPPPQLGAPPGAAESTAQEGRHTPCGPNTAPSGRGQSRREVRCQGSQGCFRASHNTHIRVTC